MRSIAAFSWLLTAMLIGRDVLADEPVDYVRQIKPILAERCYTCHAAAKQKNGLRLDTAALLKQGGDGGPAVEPGQSADSLLIERITATGSTRMPPEGEGTALSAAQVSLLKRWIDEGATAPADERQQQDPRQHWSFQPPARPAVPEPGNPAWRANPLDAFIAMEHERHGAAPNPPAAKETQLRRVYLDLVGLPPSRDVLLAFLADDSPDAYETVVDRLLASPQHGERWGRHWMDVWRYSDPFGFQNEFRYSQRHIWRWRDWIVESLNADAGYDRMIVEMLAGDEVAPDDPQVLRATGFLGRNWYKYNRNDWLRETVDHTAMGFLGLTLKCARCHDHKFDPLSQEEYYRFRAFFEPHDLRIDRLPGQADPTVDGVSHVFDAQPEAPTFRFIRGDDRQPDKEHPLAPGVPEILGSARLDIQPVPLPPHAFYPSLRPFVVDELLTAARQSVAAAESQVAAAKAARLAARETRDRLANGQPAPVGDAFLADDFSKSRPDVWKTVRGEWDYANGRQTQKSLTPWAMQVTQADHPANFVARLRFKTTGGQIYRSVGLSFDVVGDTQFQAVYMSAKEPGSVQAFHRVNGAEVYPPEGIVPCPHKLNDETSLDVAVRDGLLNAWVNGQLKIVYRLPLSRTPGRFALWTLDASAEFLSLRIEPLAESARLAENATDTVPSPLGSPLTVADAERAMAQADEALRQAEFKKAIPQAELLALEARIAADRANYDRGPSRAESESRQPALARAAAQMERKFAVLKAAESVREAETAVAAGKSQPDSDAAKKALAEAEKKLEAARKTQADAQAALMKEDSTYTPLGPAYPEQSTGRRLALARWIASRDNPRTARIAVNHVWLRHFGKSLVASVADFGIRGKDPSHPALLDWLAVEFMESGWSFKHLHRLIVTSNTYRLSSQFAGSASAAVDPDNRWLWRMNTRRAEAEVVRDSLLSLAGQLDLQPGGPPVPEADGLTSRRRSLYFRLSTEHKMEFLDLFDLASPNECYERRESVVPQQALAMVNSTLAVSQSRLVAGQLTARLGAESGGVTDEAFVTAAFEAVLTRRPNGAERERCLAFLNSQTAALRLGAGAAYPGPAAPVAGAIDPAQRARENLVLVLLNHTEFVTIR